MSDPADVSRTPDSDFDQIDRSKLTPELREVADALWEEAHGAPPLDKDPVAQMLGLAPKPAHVDSFTDPDATDYARYGVRVACLGEDGDTWVAFTHDVRRAIAAVNAGHRWETGDRARIRLEKAGWWRLRDNCGCGETCPHPDGECWEDEDGLCDPMLPPCGDTYGWRGEDVEAGAEHAYPVIVFEVTTR